MSTLDAATERLLASIKQELADARRDFRGASTYGLNAPSVANVVRRVTQIAHGWVVGQAVILVGSDWVNTDTTDGTGNIDEDSVPGIVGKIIDDDTALVVFFGLLCLDGVADYSVYYLSTTPGGTTPTKPITGFIRPIFTTIGDGLCWIGNASGAIADGSITDDMLRDSAALSVIGRSANTAGTPADIVAGTDGYVLRRSGTTLGFGQIVAAGIASDAVITVKILDANVTNAKLDDIVTAGGPTGSASVVPVITYNAKGRITAVTTATITPAAIGAVDTATYSAHTHSIAGDVGGTLAATVIGALKVTTGMIALNAVGVAQLAQSLAYTVIGNSTSATANNAGITAADGTVLRRKGSGNDLVFSPDLDLGTTGSGAGLFKCYFAAAKYFEISSTGVVTIFQSSTSQLVVNASTTVTITYANSNTVTIASADFVGTSKDIKIREIDVCDAGVSKKMLILASAAY